MAAVGLVILSISIVVALLAPIVYPYDVQTTTVSGEYAQPAWVMNFPDGYGLSKNLVVVNDPAFKAPSALQEWRFFVNGQQTTSPFVSFAWSKLADGPLGGSVQVSSTSASPTTVGMSKNFHYPYHGPPRKFSLEPHFAVFKQSASPVSVRFFLDRLGERSYTLWAQNITDNGVWVTPRNTMISDLLDYLPTIGFQGDCMHYTLPTVCRQTSLKAHGLIFPDVGDYSFGFEAKLNGPGTLNVEKVGLDLAGTAYGLLGTDAYGSDLFAQDVWGTRVSLFVGFLASFIGISLGLLVGLVAGYKTGLTDEILMRFTDMMLVIPVLPLLIVLIAVLGASITNIILVIGFLGWMGFARVIRSQVLTLKERPFIEAAKAAGAGTPRILAKHVFPNIVSLTYVNLALTVPAAILFEAALSFLGLGDPTSPSWGHTLYLGTIVFASFSSWWWVIPPGIAIAIVSLSFVLIGYALDEIFNPKLRARR